MLRKAHLFNNRADDENVDSGAETAESDYSKLSSSCGELMALPSPELPQVTVHLLANPGDSLLLQYTLDHLLKWVCPGLRLFHVSERASPLRGYARPHLCLSAGYPALAVTLFLHEAYGEERILRVLDFLQRPPWQYHHTESGGARGSAGVHITSSAAPGNALLRPYLLPSRDFYSLGAGMPVWGVRPLHCGAEVVRLTLHSAYDNYEDAVRLYETVLGRRAEERKAGFCWFTLAGPGEGRGEAPPTVTLQLALKRLQPGVRVQTCGSAVLQFRAGEIGQLVPLLPNPCSPISATRWQTEDLDGNKILFQVKGCVQAQQPFVSAFPLTPAGPPPSRAALPRSSTAASGRLAPLRGIRACGRGGSGGSESQSSLEQRCWPSAPRSAGGGGGGESAGSDSSCYSSQRSSPAPPPPAPPPLASSSSSSSLALLLLEEDEEGEEPETNVDTGCAVAPSRAARPVAVGASALETLARELSRCLPDPHAHRTEQGSEVTATSPGASGSPSGEVRATGLERTAGGDAGPTLGRNRTQQAEEFFI